MQLWLATASVALCACTCATSQQKVEAGATLHVYTNLLQIPVLILSGKHGPLPPIEPGRFLLRVGDTPPFHPRVRLEGEDPLTLAVLIDGSIDGPNLPELSQSLAAISRDQLHQQDRIALYGLDGCKLRRTSTLLPPDAETVRAAVDTLETFPPFEHHWHGEKCENPMGLWDALAWVSQSLQGEPGRRVVLVITNGADGDSKLTADSTRLVATRNGVAVFAVAERYKVQQGSTPRTVSVGTKSSSPLAYITEGTGGMVMETTRNNVAGTLARFPPLLRERYIVEFSRPAGMTAGAHSLVVSVGQPKVFIRPAGTSMPVADPETADPSVEHGKLSDVPVPEEPAEPSAAPMRDLTGSTAGIPPAAANPGRP